MAQRTLIKIQPIQWLGLFALTGIAIVFINLALAIDAFTPRDQPVGYVAQDEISNFSLTSGTETVFRPEYEREFWSGNLYAYPVDAAGNVNTVAERWDQGAKNNLSLQDFDTGRFIATMKDDGTKVPFRSASLSATQQGYLTGTINLTAYTSTQIVNFLRGDRSNEDALGLRMRSAEEPGTGGPVLGDIIHCRPYYVADASTPTIFAGANDGMLHAFNTDDGTERWAYVPSMLLSKMINLAKPYGGPSNPHDYFVDGQINIGEVSVSGAETRVLFGALGAGGRGLYALNINSLGAANETEVTNKILWEVNGSTGKVNYANPATASAYDNLGYTYGTPLIVKVNAGQADALIIGNGYNDNTSGNYRAYLYVLTAETGQLIAKVATDTTGTSASPNGLFNPVAVDTNNDGYADAAYAGDLYGRMWKFDLSSGSAASWSASLLYDTGTGTGKPIVASPGVALHPEGGYMVNFGTGAIFTDSSLDTSTYYVYGIWDGAPAGNTTLVTQTLEERNYTFAGDDNRVRRVSNTQPSNVPNWADGGNKGWRVALPAGERIVGDGNFIENNRFYFTSHNPTVSTTVADTDTVIWGENWLMELDYLSGGSKNTPFLDLDANLLLNNDDRIEYIDSDTLPVTSPATVVGDPILDTKGIPVGKLLSTGVQSSPILVQLQTLNTTLFNQNPDVTFPVTEASLGVSGGHFDVEIYYGTGAGAKATATITVNSIGSSGDDYTLGGIEVDGVTIVPALTTANLTSGTATSTNAETIRSRVTGGFTATRSTNVITVTAPTVGISYNGKTFTIIPGTSDPGTPASPGVRPTGLISFTSGTSGNNAKINDTLGSQSIKVGSTSASSNDITVGTNKSPSQAATAVANAIGTSGTIDAYVGGNSITPTCASQSSSVVCLVDTSTYSNGNSISVGDRSNFGTLAFTTTATAGGVSPGAATPGWGNFAPALATATFSGGLDPSPGDPCTTCTRDVHVHQYDDEYQCTGVNMLNASDGTLNLVNAIPSTGTQFKVLVQNQYLNPAIKLHIGDATYAYYLDLGYISLKNYITSATLDLADLPTYTRANIGSFAFNMPTDALTSKDWWGNGDVRSGLIPLSPSCAYRSAGTTDGNMYKPVIPPVNGVDGPGTAGWNASTTPATASGARHGGALTFQLISASTPNSAIEQNVDGRPEYGWRVKSSEFATYVLAEYTTYWHHPNNLCFYSSGWTNTPGEDLGSTAPSDPDAGSTDPKIGDLSGSDGGTVTDIAVIVSGNVTTTTITYNTGDTATIVRTANADGTVTIVTTDADGNVTTETVAVAGGSIKTGGDERGSQSRTGRISWHELIRD